MNLINIKIFDEMSNRYDAWYEKNPHAYQSEIAALREFVPSLGKGLEIGVGTGRFALPFGIKEGVEPSRSMAAIARKRGISVYESTAESLPFEDAAFDFVTMVTTLCFLEDPQVALREAWRVLKSGGLIIIGMVDEESVIGRAHLAKRGRGEFYRNAHFYTVGQIVQWLAHSGFETVGMCQTLFQDIETLHGLEPVRDGYGEGIFVVIAARKTRRGPIASPLL